MWWSVIAFSKILSSLFNLEHFFNKNKNFHMLLANRFWNPLLWDISAASFSWHRQKGRRRAPRWGRWLPGTSWPVEKVLRSEIKKNHSPAHTLHLYYTCVCLSDTARSQGKRGQNVRRGKCSNFILCIWFSGFMVCPLQLSNQRWPTHHA